MNGRICTQESLPATSTRQHIQHTPTLVCAPFRLCVRTDIGYGLIFFCFRPVPLLITVQHPTLFLPTYNVEAKTLRQKLWANRKKVQLRDIYVYILTQFVFVLRLVRVVTPNCYGYPKVGSQRKINCGLHSTTLIILMLKCFNPMRARKKNIHP